MGFFDRFAKKQDIEEHSGMIHSRFSHFKDAVLESFSNIKKDIDSQKQWISYLYNIHTWLQHAHNEHKEISQKDLDELRRWINHLYQDSKKHEAAMKSLEKSINDTAMTHKKYIAELYRRLGEVSSKEQRLKQDIMADVHDIVQEKHDKVRQIVEEKHAEAQKHISRISEKVDRLPQYKQPEQRNPSLLTNPEQKLLNLLLAEPDPVSYTHIAEKTGNSINTVRVIMNTLKKRGLIEEHILPSGVKLFNAPNKEKVKKLYNLKHL